MRLPWLYCLFVAAALCVSACQFVPLEEALKGKLPPDKANDIITLYCQSCHIHRTFAPLEHTPRMQGIYDRLPYTETTECRTCHLVRKDTWRARHRKTIWPADVAKRSK